MDFQGLQLYLQKPILDNLVNIKYNFSPTNAPILLQSSMTKSPWTMNLETTEFDRILL